MQLEGNDRLLSEADDEKKIAVSLNYLELINSSLEDCSHDKNRQVCC